MEFPRQQLSGPPDHDLNQWISLLVIPLAQHPFPLYIYTKYHYLVRSAILPCVSTGLLCPFPKSPLFSFHGHRRIFWTPDTPRIPFLQVNAPNQNFVPWKSKYTPDFVSFTTFSLIFCSAFHCDVFYQSCRAF